MIKLGLGKWNNIPCTQAELALMQPHYTTGIDGMNALLPDRAQGPIFAQAAKMGLRETRFWQLDEDRVLRALYPNSSVSGVRERLTHRKIPAIKHRVSAQL